MNKIANFDLLFSNPEMMETLYLQGGQTQPYASPEAIAPSPLASIPNFDLLDDFEGPFVPSLDTVKAAATVRKKFNAIKLTNRLHPGESEQLRTELIQVFIKAVSQPGLEHDLGQLYKLAKRDQHLKLNYVSYARQLASPTCTLETARRMIDEMIKGS